MIFSTVRCRGTNIGFMSNEKRLNVALTRAQSLLIIIGNSETLQKCNIWNKFVEYCHRNGALTGEERSFDRENEEEDVSENE